MQIENKTKLVVDYYAKPMFDWFYKWKAMEHRNVNYMYQGFEYPKKASWVIWKSKRTGKIVKKNYDYQIK